MDQTDPRYYIKGLLVDCPYEPNPPDCELHEIRKKPLKERLEWARQLTDEQVQQIIDIHRKCLAQKEGISSRTEK